MKRVLALSIFISLAVMVASAVTAAEVKVPYIDDANQRQMIGEAYGFQGGPAIILKGPGGFFRLADSFLVYLVQPGIPEVKVGIQKVPNMIEVREPRPGGAYLRWPLRWVLWDSNGDGIADWKAPVIEFERSDPEKPIFGYPQMIRLDLKALWVEEEVDIRPILKEAGPLPKAAAP